jgi:hypothetical protein
MELHPKAMADGPLANVNDTLHFQYYAVAFIDILGQRDAFAGLDSLVPTEKSIRVERDRERDPLVGAADGRAR